MSVSEVRSPKSLREIGPWIFINRKWWICGIQTILIRSPHSGPRQYLTYPEPGCLTGATEGCAEMVTGSPSSPLVAKILVAIGRWSEHRAKQIYYSQWGPGSGYEIPIYSNPMFESQKKNEEKVSSSYKKPEQDFEAHTINFERPIATKICPSNNHHYQIRTATSRNSIPSPIPSPTCNNRLVPSPNPCPYRKRYSHRSAPTANQWHPPWPLSRKIR